MICLAKVWMRVLALGVLLMAGALAAQPALAQNANPFGAPRSEASTPVQMSEPGPVARVLGWVYAQQRRFHQALTDAVKRFRTDPAALWLLLGLSFGYGIFHAAGPGHGKAVLSSYMLANESQVRRGVVLAFAAAFVQALTAIALVAVLAMAVRTTGMMINKTANYFEMASYAMIVVIGLWLVWVKGRYLFAPAGHGHVHLHDHGGQDGHHHHHDDPLYCAEHGHAHAVDPARLTGPLSLSKAVSLVLAMGLRPCTGAILVLLFTFVNGIFLAGIASTFAMAVGTGVTVAVLAALALGSKQLVVRLLGSSSSLAAGRTVQALEAAGAVLVLLFGAVLLAAAVSAGGRPF